jgi:hypothetical protein
LKIRTYTLQLGRWGISFGFKRWVVSTAVDRVCDRARTESLLGSGLSEHAAVSYAWVERVDWPRWSARTHAIWEPGTTAQPIRHAARRGFV